MRGCPAGADDAAHLFLGIIVRLRPGVDDEQDHLSGEANRLPPLPRRGAGPGG